jgi:sialate O-acetylesterase
MTANAANRNLDPKVPDSKMPNLSLLMTLALRFFLLSLVIFTQSFGLVRAQTVASTGLKLPSLISDHMVLQTGKTPALWGWDAPGTTIKADFLDGQGKVLASVNGTTPAEGRWALKLPSLPAATSGTLHITDGATEKVIQDVVVGEVWLGSGQSNMTYDLSAGNIPPDMIEAARQEVVAANGAIRFFIVSGSGALAPQDDVGGNWFIVTPDNFKRCSAVSWYFAVALRQKIPAPVGMIVSAVGGTSVTLWMSKSDLDSCQPGPGIEKTELQNFADVNEKIIKFEEDDAAWRKAYPTPELQGHNSKTRPQGNYSNPLIFGEYYNGMIHGLVPYTIKGVLWFQADGDMNIPFAYGDLIKAMILGWRADWQEGLPFFYVEMNNMRENQQKDPAQGNDALSILRQQQQAALELPQTDVACCIDLGVLQGEPHFPNKEPLGQRLALLAFNDVYGMPCAAHSPAYDSFTVEGNKIRLRFKYAEGLRARGGGDMIGFEIRGATGSWVWAKGKIDGQNLLVWNDAIANPTEVHYAWSMNPLISMENGAGLPMRPLSTIPIKP